MAKETSRLLAKHFRNLTTAARADALTDRELVERFSIGRDEEAFAALVRRHGPMVLRVCHRVLRDGHDAEDVFQATFLVLSRKASSLRRRDSVGCFLHGVAYRLALKARTRLAQQRRHESQAAIEKHSDNPLTELTVREAQAILDDELARLPEKFRAPLVLCCLEGKSREEAARQLGWSSKLVKSRLEQGRERLHQRLTRRGLTLPAALGAALLTERAATASLSPELIRAAVQMGRACSGNGVSASIALLAESALRSTAIGKAKVVVVGLLLLTGLLAAGAGGFTPLQRPEKQIEPSSEAKAKTPEPPKPEKQQRARIDRYGDPLPDGAIARLGTTRFRHGGAIGSLYFTPDGKTLVTCGLWDGIRIWDVASGRQIRRIEEQTSGNRPLTLSPDGKWLAILSRTINPKDGPIAILKFDTGRVVRRMGKRGSGGGFGYPLYSPDGKVLAVSGQQTIELWDPEAERLLHTLTGHKDIVWCMAFSSDGKTLVSGSDDKTIRFWDVATGQQARQITHNNGVGTIAWSGDGKRLASIDVTKQGNQNGAVWYPDSRVHLWDTATGKAVRQLVIPAKEIYPKVWSGFSSVGFAPDGKTIVTGAQDGTLRVWDATSGRELRQVADFAGTAGRFAFAPDGQTVAVTDGNAAIRLIDLATGTDRLPIHGHRGGVTSVVATTDCQTIVTIGYDDTLRFWEAATGREKQRRAVSTSTFAHPQLLPDGKSYLAVGSDKMFHVHNLATSDELAVLRGHDPRSPFALSPDRKLLAFVSEDKRIRLLDPATGKERHSLMKIDNNPSGMSFTLDGRTLMVWAADKTVTVWDAATGKKLREFAGPREMRGSMPVGGGSLPYTAAVSPDGKLLAFGLQPSYVVGKPDGFLPLVDTLTGKEVRRFQGLEDGARSMAFSPDGRMLAWNGWRGPIIYLGEIATGRVRRRFVGHGGDVISLAFSVDGKMLVSGSQDTTAILWDLTGRLARADKESKPLTDDELKKHWAILAGEDAAASYRAMQALTADPARSIPYLRQRLHPVAAVEEERLTRLIADLDSDRFDAREKATAELGKHGETVLHALQKALDNRPALETRRRLEQLIEQQVRERSSSSAERLRIGRALEVLEQIGSAEAQQVLRTLATGAPGAFLTCEAKAALERLTQRSNIAP
jgi:RNA polymerase sigma factor (sigma-70 family)